MIDHISKDTIPGPKQPPRIHGEGCTCGDFARYGCPAAENYRPTASQKELTKEQEPTTEQLVLLRALILNASKPPFDVGYVDAESVEGHVDHLRSSLSKSESLRIFGVYFHASEVVVCHTGNGPTSEINAEAIAALMQAGIPLLDKIASLTARCRELESEVLRQHQRIASQQERITDLLCSYCGSPADAAGGILHKSGCAGLETVELNRLQYDALSQGAKP